MSGEHVNERADYVDQRAIPGLIKHQNSICIVTVIQHEISYFSSLETIRR